MSALHSRFNDLCRGTHFTKFMGTKITKEGTEVMCNKWRCKYCDAELQDNLTYLKQHLANENGCKACAPEIRAAALAALPAANKTHKTAHNKRNLELQEGQQPLQKRMLVTPSFFNPIQAIAADGSTSSTHSNHEQAEQQDEPQPNLQNSPAMLTPNQSRIHFAPTPSKAESDAIEKAIGFFLFGSGRPFALMDDCFFRNMVQTLRPGYVLKHSDHHRDKVLPYVHALVNTKVEQRISRAPCVTWSADDSEDARRIGVSNIIACTPQPYLVASLPKTEVERGSSQKLAAKLLPIMEQRPNTVAFISDTENKMQATQKALATAWEKKDSTLTMKLITLLCQSHGWNLFLGDCFTKIEYFHDQELECRCVVTHAALFCHRLMRLLL